jgi:UDP-2-acetamido-3-amino-2,3-dideoxy-glucuronate N-acetyltransferase
VPQEEARGQHAHKTCHQFMVCISGSVTALVDDGRQRRTIALDSPSKGLHLPPGIWGTQYGYAPSTVLAVFASHAYDADDYIVDYDDFLRRMEVTQ